MNLHYQIVHKEGQPLILYLHGFMGSSGDWSRIFPHLGASYCHLAVDLPGHGASLNQSCYNASATMKALLTILDRLAVDKPVLLGYSLGGRLALRLALQYPQHFAALVLESASPGLRTESERRTRRYNDEQLARKLETADYREFLQHWYRQPLFGHLTRHADFSHLLERRLKNNPLELAKALRGLSVAEQPSLWERLPEIKLPTLLLCGQLDEKYRRLSKEMQRRNPRLQRVVIAHSGHNTHFEQSAAFVRALKSFLASNKM